MIMDYNNIIIIIIIVIIIIAITAAVIIIVVNAVWKKRISALILMSISTFHTFQDF